MTGVRATRWVALVGEPSARPYHSLPMGDKIRVCEDEDFFITDNLRIGAG